jgi:hypothetical protein
MKKGGQRFDIEEWTWSWQCGWTQTSEDVVKLAVVHYLVVHCQGSVRRCPTGFQTKMT